MGRLLVFCCGPDSDLPFGSVWHHIWVYFSRQPQHIVYKPVEKGGIAV
jgi:hypothetical protein